MILSYWYCYLLYVKLQFLDLYIQFNVVLCLIDSLLSHMEIMNEAGLTETKCSLKWYAVQILLCYYSAHILVTNFFILDLNIVQPSCVVVSFCVGFILLVYL